MRLELAALYRKMDRGEIESQEDTRQAYVSKLIATVLVVTELVRRVEELEQMRARATIPSATY